MQVLLVSADLMMIAAAQGAADRHRVRLAAYSSTESATNAADETVSLAMVDLRTPGLNIADGTPKLRQAYPQAKIVACGPHVHKQSLQAAAAAGCDEVITRGEFERRLDGLLAEVIAAADRE